MLLHELYAGHRKALSKNAPLPEHEGDSYEEADGDEGEEGEEGRKGWWVYIQDAYIAQENGSI